MTQATAEREDLAEKASEFLLGVLERMGISADIDIKDDTDKTVLEIQTGDTELVIGRRGVVIDALQHLVNKAVFKEKRDEKTAELYAFITSDRCKQLLDQIALQAQRMLELEAAEERAHRMTWEKRGKLIRSVQKVHSDLCFEIERVIGTGGNEAVADDTAAYDD